MRKILLASTALVAVAGVSAASADGHISFSGSADFTYTSVSDNVEDNTTNGENGTSMSADSQLAASWSTTTDSGLEIAVAYDVDANSGDWSITGDWGTFTFDEGSEAMGTGAADADSVSNMSFGMTPEYGGGNGINGGIIAYSNTIGPISFAVGMGDGGTDATDGDGEANETSYGVSYSANVNGADVSIGYAAASTGSATSADDSADLNASSMNVGVTVGSIGVAMAQNAQKADQNDGLDNTSATNQSDLKSTNFGLTYAVSDSLSLEAASIAAEGTINGDDTYKYDESAYGVAYTIATGLSLTISYSDFTQSGGAAIDDVSGSATMVDLSVSF